jgi:hypothetical protein
MVTMADELQPVARVYQIVSVPAVIPITIPDPDPIVALVLLALQAPPVVPSASVVVCPVHTLCVPVIPTGAAFTVTVFVAWHPILKA